jgi:ABC-type dipeptide/oligopeptide/nickel transport system ATPase component
VTHNLALVRSVAQEVLVLQAGRIVEAGSVDAVLDHPSQPYTAQLVSDVPKVPAATWREPMRLVTITTPREPI